MFVDRQSIFSSLFSLKFITHSGEIRRFQAANIGKIRKTQTFFIKKVFFSSQKEAMIHGFRGNNGRSTATAAVTSQRQKPAREPEAQQHIVGRLEVRNGIGAKHERTDAVVRHIVLDIVEAVLHSGASHLTAHQGFGAGTPELLERHSLPFA